LQYAKNNPLNISRIAKQILSLQRLPFGSAAKDGKKGREFKILRIKDYEEEKN